MKRFDDIAVGIDPYQEGFDRDGSMPPQVESLLAHVRWLHGRSADARVTVLAVVSDDTEGDDTGPAREVLEATVMPALEGTGAELVVTEGYAHVEMIRAVQRRGCDLLMVAARPHGLLDHNIAGGTAKRLLRKAPCPVWVTPRRFTNEPAVVLSAVGFHGLSVHILDLSAELVEATGGTWHVLHCMEYFEEGSMRLRRESPDAIAEYRRHARERDWERMHALADPLARQYGLEPRYWLAEGAAHEQIVLAARRLDASVLVMGTVGRAGLPGLIVGNTAEKVIATAECSVLAVKPEGFVSPVT